MNDRRFLVLGLACLGLAVIAAGCSGGGGGGNAGTSSFQVSDISLHNGAVWQINREIVITFTDPVDFGTVSANTINIRSVADVPATGVFRLRDPRTVVFQPNCPTRDDLSDAGLQPGGVSYVLRIEGLDTSVNMVRSVEGVPLGFQQTRSFSTPASSQNSAAFQDTQAGPPLPVLRAQGTTDTAATHLEIGGDPSNTVYFEHDPANPAVPVLSVPDFKMPLNLYADRATNVVVVIEFNQPVNPSSSNISINRLRLEFEDGPGVWRPIDTRITLAANCTETGARVRLEPVGVLPADSALRAVILPGFQDLVGQTTVSEVNTFAEAPTKAVDFTSLTPTDLLSDEFKESFNFGGSSPLSFEDTTALFDSPTADWGGGQLSAAFSFDGTGGPNGNFDWIVHDGETFFFDTTSTPIVGGPNGVPTATLNTVNGVVDLRNLIIEPGGEIRVQGPNPMRINATGDVHINGKLDLSGFNAKDVATLNTGNQQEIGGAGAAGGGKGGNASEVTTSSTPRGGRGQGPFRQANLGGEGGETGYAPDSTGNPNGTAKDTRRPGGGGGGRFSRDWVGTSLPSVAGVPTVSVAAGPGRDGNPASTGAVLQAVGTPAKGGLPGDGPFLDTSTQNDFFGTRPVISGGVITGLIRGELPSLWAGYGGGGGGNADPFNRFPSPNWNFGSDEKGGGGGGSAGGLHIKALGRIVFGAEGVIVATGGRGGTGENVNFLDHIGGTGGGGSGGHIILESATLVDFTDGGANTAAPLADYINATGPLIKQGNLGDVNGCCKSNSNGGAGGGGVIQIHVPDTISPPNTDPTTTDIVVPDDVVGALNPLDQIASPPPYVLIPTFGARSKVQSKWISIGGADQKPDGSEGLVRFLFGGIDANGKIQTNGTSTVADLPAIVVDNDLLGSSTATLLPDGFSIRLSGAALDAIRAGNTAGISNDIYLRTPALLQDFALRMLIVETPQNLEDFSIASAVYAEGSVALGDETLTVTVSSERGTLQHFIDVNGTTGTVGFQILPRFFRVVTSGAKDSLPTSAFVRFQFQAARDNGAGAPDENAPLVDWTSDITQFNGLAAGQLQFFRFQVEFDLDAQAQGVSANTEPVSLEFLRVPFVF